MAGLLISDEMKNKEVISHIVAWLDDYASKSRVSGFVVGISGGIDSALTSTLCAMTGRKTLVLQLPIHQATLEVKRAEEHISWLKNRFANVQPDVIDLTAVYDAFHSSVKAGMSEKDLLALANTRSRLRMTALYHFACIHGLLVAGTGNKVEDFGVGFFTKYGDGGVDISPIGDLYKTQVTQLSASLGIVNSILTAAPSDGLFDDGRTDEDQIGASYTELEWAMEFLKSGGKEGDASLSQRHKEVLSIYLKRNRVNFHKMTPIPVCIIPDSLK